MEAVAYTDLRQNLSIYMDQVVQNSDSLIVTRRNRENVVLISVDEYNSLLETNYLLSNEANVEHLRKSIDQHKAGKIKTRDLYENE
jgi:antitoxin YefM